MVHRWRSVADHLQTVATNCRGSSFSPRFQYGSYHTIQAVPRVCTGSEASASDRQQGIIPTVVCHQNLLDKNGFQALSVKHFLTTEWKQIIAILKSAPVPFFYSTRFPLQIHAAPGSSQLLESGTVLPIKIGRDKKSGKIQNLVFVCAEDGLELKVNVPVVYKGEDACPGLQKDGYLSRVRSSLKYLCPSEHIPSKIEVDVSSLNIGDRVLVRDIEVHPSLKLLSKIENRPICKLVPARSTKNKMKMEKKKVPTSIEAPAGE